MPLIGADNVAALSALLLILTLIGIWTDNHPVLRRTSGVLWVLGGGMLLSNLYVVPFESPTYGVVFSLVVPAAIPLLLLKADLRKIIRGTGKLLLIFLLGSVTVIIGTLLGFFLLDLGPIGPQVAGVYTGGWIGGTVNFVGVSQAVGLEGAEFAAAISASSPVSVIGLMALIAIPSIAAITRAIPTRFGADEELEDAAAEADDRPAFRPVEIAALLALSLTICAVSQLIAALIDFPSAMILVVTILTLVVANLFPRQMERFRVDFDLGMLLMYVFFASIGMSTNATAFLDNAVTLFLFGLIIIAVHIGLVLLAAKLLRIDLADAIIASAANIVGPVPAAAIATSRGWKSLVTPGIMCGIFGYAIATFIGIGITILLS